jgi:type I restriction enzyme S subunit
LAQGAAQQNVSKEKVVNAPAMLPPISVVEQFTRAAGPPWRLSHHLSYETRAIARVRDLLLPKLVSGQIDVSSLDLDAVLGSVA